MIVTATRHPLVTIPAGQPMPPLPKTAWLEIDLDALTGNVRVFRRMLPGGTRIDGVVKADAYGHGAVAVSRALDVPGIRNLAVATYDEALELRQAGIGAPILIFFPIPAELVADAWRNRFAITVGDDDLSARSLEALASAPASAAPTVGPGPEGALGVHVEIETGLGRGGVALERVPALVAAIEANPRARFAGLWSHLQAAGDAENAGGQAARFLSASSALDAGRLALIGRHIAASGAVLAATVPPYEAVRIGLSLYGLVPDGLTVAERHGAAAAGLRPVMSLRAKPIRVARLESGTGVSYGPTFRTERPSVVATLPLGYADGWPRSLSNKAQVLLRGRRVPQIGTVAMDALMVDVTDVPGPAVTVDDVFTLIGRQGDEEITAHQVARWGNTISYEVIAGMSGRLPRVYYAAAEPVAIRTVACELDWAGDEP
jgi:alanine racemase